jgi:hypothetical protein
VLVIIERDGQQIFNPRKRWGTFIDPTFHYFILVVNSNANIEVSQLEGFHNGGHLALSNRGKMS